VGRYAEARRTAEAFATNAQPGVALVPMIEYALSTPLFVDLRFGRWREAAQASAAAETPLSRALWHFTRGVAQARLGHRKEAMASRAAFAAARTTVPREAPYGDTGLNRAGVILDLAGRILDARIAAAGRDHAETLAAWRDAVAIDDTLAYEEPPVWYYPVRESLGAALLLRRRHADAEEVFRADLARNPRNPRSLFGLHESLEAQGRRADADWVRRAFVRVWAGGELRIEDL
jgi:tetratricopeptide (TPR) repeat protein